MAYRLMFNVKDDVRLLHILTSTDKFLSEE